MISIHDFIPDIITNLVIIDINSNLISIRELLINKKIIEVNNKVYYNIDYVMVNFYVDNRVESL